MKQFMPWSIAKLCLGLSAAVLLAFACAAPPGAQMGATATTFLPTVAQSTAIIIKLPTQPPQPTAPAATATPPAGALPVAGYKVVTSYPHDRAAFTQGLVYTDGLLYEGTGLNGRSSLRRVKLETGEVLQSVPLPQQYFGEGIALLGDKIYQLTWQSRVGFIYDKNSLAQTGQWSYTTEGWGLTTDGTRLFMSDGTAMLYTIDPATMQVVGHIEVVGDAGPVARLNELEYVNGEIYANIWQTDRIARIDPATGRVLGWIDLTGLLPPEERTEPVDVLNGIAYDPATDRLFVTGKLWPKLYEIDIVSK